MNDVAIYARVSTVDQSTATQVTRLRGAATQMGLDLSEDRVLVDDGVSGRAMSRPQFDKVREIVHSRS
ncbi:MAG: recombinase family protein, partial [Thermoplasmata archaeon]